MGIVVAIAALGCDAPSAPPVDRCAAPSAGSIDRLEVGAAMPSAFGVQQPFAPLADGDTMKLVRGPQGADMLGFVLRIFGASAPACLGQELVVTDAMGARVTSSSAPLATYAEADGTRLTHGLWLPAAYPPSFVVSVAAASQSLTLHLALAQ